MESSGTPASAGGSTAAPPPSTPAGGGARKAGGGWRALAVVLALVLGFLAAVMIVLPLNPDDTPRCEQITSGEIVALECYDLTETQQTVQNVVAWPAGVLSAIAALIALFFAATGRRGALLVRVTVGAVVLAGLAFVIGQL